MHVHECACSHKKIIFKVGPLSWDDFANHIFPVLLYWGFRPSLMSKVLLGEWFLTFKGTTLLWKNGKHSPNTEAHPRRLESLAIPLRLPHFTFIFFQMLHPTASICSPIFQKYLNLILWEDFRNDVKVHMLHTCGRILVATDYCSRTFVMTQISTSTLKQTNLPKFQHSLFANHFNGC